MAEPGVAHRALAEALQPAPWSSLSVAGADALLAAGRLMSARRNKPIDVSKGVVARGVLAITAQTIDGRQALCEIFTVGDVVDLRPSDRPMFGDLVVLADATLLAFAPNDIDAVLQTRPDVSSVWRDRQLDQLDRLRRHCFDIAFKTPLERLASALREFEEWPTVGGERRRGDRFELPLQQIELAQYLGVTPETVSRSLRQLSDEGVIGADEKNAISIADPDALRLIARGGRPRASTRRASQ